MFKRTETEIIESWLPGQPVLVSVCCITYNQEKYISQTMEGFLMQKTTFPFEIIIGEDRSDDNTLRILEEYKCRYPSIIKIITSNVNVGANANLLRVFNSAQGKYIALCEGDDFWISHRKLQIQFETLEKQCQANVCFHYAYKEDAKTKKRSAVIKNDSIQVSYASSVLNQLNQYAPTSSYFFRKEIVKQLPDWFCNSTIGDIFIELYSMNNSYGLYLPYVMSVYRVNLRESWSGEINSNINSLKEKYSNFVSCLNLAKKDINCDCREFDKKIAHVYLNQAVRLLMAERISEFNSSICDSVSYCKFISMRQFFLYYLRRFPYSIMALSRINRYLRSIR